MSSPGTHRGPNRSDRGCGSRTSREPVDGSQSCKGRDTSVSVSEKEPRTRFYSTTEETESSGTRSCDRNELKEDW